MTILAQREDYSIRAGLTGLDVAFVHGFLTQSYWANGISIETVKMSLERSDCFGLFHDEEQIGLARVVTDGVTVAYLADVFVVEQQRGRGLGGWLIETVLNLPAYKDMRSWMLLTKDAQSFYNALGFSPHEDPTRLMVRRSKAMRESMNAERSKEP